MPIIKTRMMNPIKYTCPVGKSKTTDDDFKRRRTTHKFNPINIRLNMNAKASLMRSNLTSTIENGNNIK